MSEIDPYHQSYLASVVRRRRAERLYENRVNMLLLASAAIIYIGVVAIVCTFAVYNG